MRFASGSASGGGSLQSPVDSVATRVDDRLCARSIALLRHVMAMAAMHGVSILHKNSPSSHSIVIRKDSRSFESSQASRSLVIGPGSCISLPSLETRSRTSGRYVLWLAKAGGEEGSDSAQEKVDSNNNSTTTSVAPPGEPKLGGGGGAKGFGTPPKASTTEKKRSSKSASGSIRRPPPSKPLIGVSPADQQTQQVETAVVASLVFLFALIFLEGLILAGSGFLPEEWDEFAVNSIYPTFTPSVGVFLAIAASYGLWKSLGGGAGTSSK